MAARLRRATGSRLLLCNSARLGRCRPACAHVLLYSFLYDRIARAAYDYRNRRPYRAYDHGAPRPLHARILRAARSQRPLLALRGHRVDLSLSGDLSHWRVVYGSWALMSEHIVL